SHHDLMRAFERMLRRADLPFRSSQGFSPRPRLVFALSLPLGVVGCGEVVELQLERALPLEEIEQRLAGPAPPSLVVLSALPSPPPRSPSPSPQRGGGGEATAARTALEMDLWLTPGGTARPDEVLGLLGLQDLLEIGAVLERTRLELHDEITPPLVEGIA